MKKNKNNMMYHVLKNMRQSMLFIMPDNTGYISHEV